MAALLLFSAAHAQVRLPINNAFRNNVQKVVEDFPSRFASLKGEELVTNPQTVQYASLLTMDQAESCIITQYSSSNRQVYTWQAVMLSTEDFNEAVKKYKWMYNQLKGLNVKYVVDLYTLRGTYEAPTEDRKFWTSNLVVADAPEPLQKLRIEVAMQFEFPEWKVLLTVFEKERDDDKRGDVDD